MTTILKRLSQTLFEDKPRWIERMLVADEELAAHRRAGEFVEEQGVIEPAGAGADRGCEVTVLTKENARGNKHRC